MAYVVCVSFRGGGGRVYYFDPGEIELELGDHVIAETAKGLEFGRVVAERHWVPDERIPQPLKPIIRRATPEDFARDAENREKEKEALKICARKIEQHKLPMRLIDVSYTFDGARIVFYFAAEGRVDFRSLVRDLAATFRTRIELHQIGVRDQARLLGGFGPCGRPLCCSTFIGEFQPVAIKMAKEQGLSLNPNKISGVCGRLMCCLRYEYDTYVELRKNLPALKSEVHTPQGPAKVEGLDVLRGLVYAVFPSGEGKWYHYSQLRWPGAPAEQPAQAEVPTPQAPPPELIEQPAEPSETLAVEDEEAEEQLSEPVVSPPPEAPSAEPPQAEAQQSTPGQAAAQTSRRRRSRRRRSRRRRRSKSVGNSAQREQRK